MVEQDYPPQEPSRCSVLGDVCHNIDRKVVNDAIEHVSHGGCRMKVTAMADGMFGSKESIRCVRPQNPRKDI